MSCAMVWRGALVRFSAGPNPTAASGRAASTAELRSSLRRDGAALRGDDRVLLVVRIAEAGIVPVNVRSELGDAMPAGEGREIDEMYRHGRRKLHVDLLAAFDLRLDLFERPALLRSEQP